MYSRLAGPGFWGFSLSSTPISAQDHLGGRHVLPDPAAHWFWIVKFRSSGLSVGPETTAPSPQPVSCSLVFCCSVVAVMLSAICGLPCPLYSVCHIPAPATSLRLRIFLENLPIIIRLQILGCRLSWNHTPKQEYIFQGFVRCFLNVIFLYSAR